MKLKDFEKKSPHEVQAFLQRVAKFYKSSEEKAFELLRLFITKSLPSCYRQDDLIDEVISRLLAIDTKRRQDGDEIRDYQHMARKVIRLLCHEADKWQKKGPLAIYDLPSDLTTSIEGDIETIEIELKYKCYLMCLEQNPKIVEAFLEYYPDILMTRHELSELHRSIAQKLIEGDGSSQRKKNTMEVRIKRERDTLPDCVRPCYEAASANHPELQRLYEQRLRSVQN